MDNNEQEKATSSGETSPTNTRSKSSTGLVRSDSQETLRSSIPDTESNASYNYPAPPLNSPQTQSVAGDLQQGVNMESLATRLKGAHVAPPASLRDAGKPVQRGRPAKKLNVTFTTDADEGRDGSKTPTKGSIFMEHSTWENIAEEDVEKGLLRMVMLARDENQKDGSKTVEQYYSERLAKMIKKCEVAFDSKHLQ